MKRFLTILFMAVIVLSGCSSSPSLSLVDKLTIVLDNKDATTEYYTVVNNLIYERTIDYIEFECEFKQTYTDDSYYNDSSFISGTKVIYDYYDSLGIVLRSQWVNDIRVTRYKELYPDE